MGRKNRTVNIGGALTKLLNEQGKGSGEKLAKAIGITKSSVSLLKRGEAAPGMDVLVAIADYFGVTTDFLLGRKNPVGFQNGYDAGYKAALMDCATAVERLAGDMREVYRRKINNAG